MAARNLLNLESVRKSYGRQPLLDGVSLGVAESERIGVIGRNGGGKSTLLSILSGMEPVDSGRATQATGMRLGVLSQVAVVEPGLSLREFVIGDRREHEWASDPRTRGVLTALLGGHAPAALDRTIGQL